MSSFYILELLRMWRTSRVALQGDDQRWALPRIEIRTVARRPNFGALKLFLSTEPLKARHGFMFDGFFEFPRCKINLSSSKFPVLRFLIASVYVRIQRNWKVRDNCG